MQVEMGFLPFYFSLKYTCAFLLPTSGEAQSFLITSHGDKCFAIIITQGRSITYPCILNLPLLKDEKKNHEDSDEARSEMASYNLIIYFVFLSFLFL